MMVEPESFCWLVGRLTPKRDGATWLAELQRWSGLEYLVSDAGSGLCRGVKMLQRQRRTMRQKRLLHSLDVFHVLQEGSRALGREYTPVRRGLRVAEREQKRIERRAWHGQSNRGRTKAARCWQRAEKLLDQAAAREHAWQKVRTALELFTPQGRLNDRAAATGLIAEALPQLPGKIWAKTRRLLQRRATFGFLDRLQERVATLKLSADTLSALSNLEWLRRHPEQRQGDARAAGAARGLALIRTVQLAKSEPDYPETLKQFRQTLRDTWRASSLVEGINSVSRMQQARHRRMTQGLMDLKRLYWNTRRFRTGRRKGSSPYELLGLKLSMNWWDLLKLSPEQLQQRLSAQKHAA